MNLRKIITNLFSDFTPKLIPKYLLLFVAIIGICVGSEDDFYEEIGRTIREKKELSSEAPATDAAGEQID